MKWNWHFEDEPRITFHEPSSSIPVRGEGIPRACDCVTVIVRNNSITYATWMHDWAICNWCAFPMDMKSRKRSTYQVSISSQE